MRLVLKAHARKLTRRPSFPRRVGEEAKILGEVGNATELLSVLEYLREARYTYARHAHLPPSRLTHRARRSIQMSAEISTIFPSCHPPDPSGFKQVSGILVIPWVASSALTSLDHADVPCFAVSHRRAKIFSSSRVYRNSRRSSGWRPTCRATPAARASRFGASASRVGLGHGATRC